MSNRISNKVKKVLKNSCFYCGITIIPPNYTRDHIFPKSYLKLGYPKRCRKAYNVVPCCKECNDMKGDLIPRYVRPCYFLVIGKKREYYNGR